jgi:tRNA 2-thiouridine synthesizing protein D
MDKAKTLTFIPLASAASMTLSAVAVRLDSNGASISTNVSIFAYEGAVMLPFRHQQPHPNAVHGRDVEQEDHPLPREWIAGMMDCAAKKGLGFEWVNCGLCVDERGAGDAIDGVRRGTPADLWKTASSSHNTLVVATS